MDLMQVLNFGSLLILISIGFYCACRLNHNYPLWLRLIVLSPALSSFLKISEIFAEGYLPINSDIVQRLAVCLLYALVASSFFKRPWIRIRCSPRPRKKLS